METNEANGAQAFEQAPDTQHEPHEHASRRVLIGVTATVLVFIVGGFVWARWGGVIEEICFGDGDACRVELTPTSDGGTQFNNPPEYQF